MTRNTLAWLGGTLGLFTLIACGDGATDRPEPGDAGSADGGGDHTPVDASLEHDAGLPPDEADAATEQDAGAQGSPHWFLEKTPLALKISAPLGDAFRAAFAGVPDGIVPPDRKKDPFAGTFVVAAGESESVELAVRGNSSLQECEFPKLKVGLATRSDDASDVFFATKKLKIGTHCGEETEVNGTIGRLRNELATYREELAYQLARELGIVTLATRPAVVEYSDTSSEPLFASPLKRKAFVLEHVDELARRLGAEALSDPSDCGDDPNLKPDAKAVLRVKFFHAMIGNWDFGLGPAESNGCGPLWNTEVLVHPEGYLTLVPADFDLSAFVVAEVRDPETNQLVPIDADNAKVSARGYLATATDGWPAEAVTAMKAEYAAKKDALLALVNDSLADDAGKAAARLLLEGFFAVLTEPAK